MFGATWQLFEKSNSFCRALLHVCLVAIITAPVFRRPVVLHRPQFQSMLFLCLCYPWCLLLHGLLTNLILQAWDSITDGGLPADKEQPLHTGAQLQVSQQPCGACWFSLILDRAECGSVADGSWAHPPTLL